MFYMVNEKKSHLCKYSKCNSVTYNKYFCSLKCSYKWKVGRDKNGNLRKEKKLCLFCGNVIHRNKLKNVVSNKYWKNRKFCSKKCFYKWRVNIGIDVYNKKIRKLKKCGCGCCKTLKSLCYYVDGGKRFTRYLAGHNPVFEETIRKIIISQTGRKLLKSSVKKRTVTRKKNGWFKDEKKTKKIMSEVRKGIKFSATHLKNLSESHKNHYPTKKTRMLLRKNSVRYWKGKHLSTKTKEKLRIATINYIKNNGFPMIVNTGRNEKEILDVCEIEFNTKINRLYRVNHYFLDGYSKKLNIAFEVDEMAHCHNLKKDLQRQREIEKELNCEFIRILDY